MNSLQYSTPALNVLNRFHQRNHVIYVEGIDDIQFWNAMFNNAGITNCHFEDVGGKNELEEIIRKIVEEDASVIVAMDSDYSMILGSVIEHPQIIYTYGYSIENTMYCPATTNRIINKISRLIVDLEEEIEQWMTKNFSVVKPLIAYDIANIKFLKSVSVLGENCCRFLKTRKSEYLSESRITQLISGLEEYFTEDEFKTCENLIENSDYSPRQIIKGHFLTHAVINYIKNQVKKLSGSSAVVSLDNLYALSVDGCMNCSHQCIELDQIIQSVRNAVEVLE